MAVGNSLAVQWLAVWAFTAKGLGSISGQGTKLPQAPQLGQKKKERKKMALGCITFKNHCVPTEPN